MSIVGFSFLVFISILTIVYFLVPKRWQWSVILIANVVFYAFSGIKYLGYMVFTIIITYFIALKLESINKSTKSTLSKISDRDEKRAIKAQSIKVKKRWATFAVVAVMGIWVVIKYGNFFIDNVNTVIAKHNGTLWSPLSLVLPLGMSFYTFQSVGYLVDVYRGKYPAEHNIFRYATFISFFPHITQGPFSRFDELGATLFQEHSFDYIRLRNGVRRMLWGAFQKIVVADVLGVCVTRIFDHYENYTGVQVICVAFFYSIQLYADFSGYMNIACGFSKILGIDLAENFRQPYFARSVEEFWRRWHITLGAWFKDYVFYSVSLSKLAQKMGHNAREKWGPKLGKYLPSYFALIFVWTATGLWHGASWTYLVWGYLNLIVIVAGQHLGEYYLAARHALHIADDSKWFGFFQIIRTFILVTMFRFFSRGKDIATAFAMLKRMFINLNLSALKNPSALFVGLNWTQIFAVLIGIAAIFTVDVLNETGKWETVKEKTPAVIRYTVYTLLILAILLFLVPIDSSIEGFIYAAF